MRTVVGIECVGEKDWVDAYGHYWAWDKHRGLWVHDRDRCRLDGGQACLRRAR
jgi:hypothetical protein